MRAFSPGLGEVELRHHGKWRAFGSFRRAQPWDAPASDPVVRQDCVGLSMNAEAALQNEPIKLVPGTVFAMPAGGYLRGKYVSIPATLPVAATLVDPTGEDQALDRDLFHGIQPTGQVVLQTGGVLVVRLSVRPGEMVPLPTEGAGMALMCLTPKVLVGTTGDTTHAIAAMQAMDMLGEGDTRMDLTEDVYEDYLSDARPRGAEGEEYAGLLSLARLGPGSVATAVGAERPFLYVPDAWPEPATVLALLG